MGSPRRILERRRSVRIAEPFLFKIGHQGYDVQAITLNISTHGAMCVVDKDIPMMSQLRIGLELPAQKPRAKSKYLSLKGVLVRKEKDEKTGRFLIALYFSDLSSSDEKNLAQFIDRYLKAA